MTKLYRPVGSKRISSKGIIFEDKQTLDEWRNTVQTKTRILVGMFPLLANPTSGSTGGTGIQIGTVYSFKQNLLSSFPIKDGFTRTYKVVGTMTTSDNNVVVKLGGYEVFSECVWGSYNSLNSRPGTREVTDIINKIGTRHASITVDNTKGTSGNLWWFLGRLDLLVYDEQV